MGRPNRKRQRETEQETLMRKPPPPLDRNPSYPFGECCNSSLQSLVIDCGGALTREATDGAGAGKKMATARGLVQAVWGGLSKSDLTAASSTLSVGIDVNVDDAGVAWLVNTSIHEQEAGVGSTRTPPLPEKAGCCKRTSDHQVSAKEAAFSAAGRDARPTAPRPSGGCGRQEAQEAASPFSDTLFNACDASLREQLSRVKEQFEEIPPVVFKRARSACNPAEALGSGSFLNRSAMKLANIDALLGGQLSQPSRPSAEVGTAPEKTTPTEGGRNREPLQTRQSASTLLFADLCGGPGGFSEYLLRRRRQLGLPARGWGISLRDGAGGDVSGPGNTDAVEDTAVGDSTDERGRTAGMMVSGVGDRDDYRCVPEVRGGDGSTAETDMTPEQGTGSMARGGVSGRGNGAREETSQDGHRRKKKDEEDDPCAWRLDHLRPWCDVSVLAPGTAMAASTCVTELPREGGGHEGAEATDAISTARNAPNGFPSSAADIGDPATIPSFEMRIEHGPKGTGDVTDEGNLQGFVDSVLASTGGRRLDLVVADGGFGAARDDPEQERALSALLHAEAFAALLLLEKGGSFVCKLFECWTESTAALVYLLHRKFRRIAIVKPLTSRPASGERYLVCMGFSSQPSSTSACQFTDALLGKVKAMQGMRSCRTGPVSCPPDLKDPRDLTSEKARCPAERPVREGGKVEGAGDGADVGDCGCDGAVLGQANVTLGVEAETKQDASFMSFLRLSNNALARLQAKTCARIVGVASTKRGRAWAFRDSNGNRGIGPRGRNKQIGGNTVGKVCDTAAGARDGDDAAAVRCFWLAWDLDGL